MPAKRCFATKEELEELYINQNKSLEEIAEDYGMSRSGMQKIICAFKIKKDPQKARELAQKTMLEKYGTTVSLNVPGAKEKMKQTSLEKYGCEHPSQNKEIKEKTKKSIEARGGYPTQTEEGRAKIRKTNLERYGCENPMQNKDVQEKGKQTCLERYGATNIFGSEIGKQKVKEGMLRNHGVEHISKKPEYVEHMHQLWKEKYGTDWFFQTDEFKDKSKQTSLERYGTEYPFQNEEIKEKQQQVMLEHWGSRFASQVPEIKEKSRKRYMEQYGVPNNKQRHWSELTKKALLSKEGLEEFIDAHPDCSTIQLAEFLSCEFGTLGKYLTKYGLWHKINQFDSKQEREVGKLLDEWGIRHSKRKGVIFPFEIDEYCDDLNKGIEIDGNYWHSEYKVDKYYHQKKNLWGESKGVPLFHIWQYEWDNPELRKGVIHKLRIFLGLEEENDILPDELPEIIYADYGKNMCETYLAAGYECDGVTEPQYVWINAKQEVAQPWEDDKDKEDEQMHAKKFWKIYDSGQKIWKLNK